MLFFNMGNVCTQRMRDAVLVCQTMGNICMRDAMLVFQTMGNICVRDAVLVCQTMENICMGDAVLVCQTMRNVSTQSVRFCSSFCEEYCEHLLACAGFMAVNVFSVCLQISSCAVELFVHAVLLVLTWSYWKWFRGVEYRNALLQKLYCPSTA